MLCCLYDGDNDDDDDNGDRYADYDTHLFGSGGGQS
jgi:hypothetical protein